MSCAILLVLWILFAVIDTFGPHMVEVDGKLVPMARAAIFQLELVTYLRWIPFSLIVVAVTDQVTRRTLTVQVLTQLALLAFCVVGFSVFGAYHVGILSRGVRNAIQLRGAQAFTFYLITLGVYYAVSSTWRAHTHRVEARQLETQLAESRLNALRMQLQPHFLFNTLHAISSAIEDTPREARRMITLLGELLRLTLERSSTAEVTVREELAWIERYLALQRLRFGERLDVEISAEPAALSACVPTLVLQPLVENALVHGADPETGVTVLRISARIVDGRLALCVADEGRGLTSTLRPAETEAGRGIGLRNTRERLQVAYGDDHQLRIGQSGGQGTTVVITLPLARHAAA